MCTNHDFSLERWLPVKGWEEFYEVSDFGRVRSFDRHISYINCWRTVTNRFIPGRIMALGDNGHGYLQLQLKAFGVTEPRYVHDLVLTHFVSERPEGMEACHGPLGQSCNAVTNLEWNTRSVNQNEHRRRDGTFLFGDIHPSSKLTAESVTEIYDRYAAGELGDNLAAEFGVNIATVMRIGTGKTWQHLNLPPRRKTSAGENNGKTNLTEADVREIYRRVKAGEFQRVVGADFGLTQTGVSFIMLGKSWKHLNLLESVAELAA